VIKRLYPHSIHGTTAAGHPIYIEQVNTHAHKDASSSSPDDSTLPAIAVPSRGPLISPLNSRASPCDRDEWSAVPRHPPSLVTNTHSHFPAVARLLLLSHDVGGQGPGPARRLGGRGGHHRGAEPPLRAEPGVHVARRGPRGAHRPGRDTLRPRGGLHGHACRAGITAALVGVSLVLLFL
jgi:hypothetical protein